MEQQKNSANPKAVKAAIKPAGPEGKTSPKEAPKKPAQKSAQKLAKEFGGPAGPEPTRYGDWEQKGRCTDF